MTVLSLAGMAHDVHEHYIFCKEMDHHLSLQLLHSVPFLTITFTS